MVNDSFISNYTPNQDKLANVIRQDGQHGRGDSAPTILVCLLLNPADKRRQLGKGDESAAA